MFFTNGARWIRCQLGSSELSSLETHDDAIADANIVGFSHLGVQRNEVAFVSHRHKGGVPACDTKRRSNSDETSIGQVMELLRDRLRHGYVIPATFLGE